MCSVHASKGTSQLGARSIGQSSVWLTVLRSPARSRVLVHSFGDEQYVWAKPEALVLFSAGEDALQSASERVRPAILDAIAAQSPKKAKKAPATPVKAAQPPVVVPSLSAYELQRLQNIKDNQLKLQALGLEAVAKEVREMVSTPEKASIDPAVRAARIQERAARLVEAQANRRASSRLTGERAAPVRYADEYDAAAEAEEAALYRRSRKRARAAGGGRGSRGGGANDAALGPEERAALAEAYEEAEGWLEEMRRFFTDKLSEANLRNVMKQATALATGAGIPHTRKSNWFRRGEPVTLDEDLVELRAAANKFLLPEDDPGHGWRLDHPIGKMGIFQAYLHARGV